ncbi:PREDICTED: ethylene-insensitive protein 2-like [Nelumbo nucifera]|uniref:Ethylene-insensitive protein 2-like n=1 Tax=Nelumbo nucifera TaxID=4432 RepID=A0A1U7ZIZ9_NELNU|nr:PREDICTED: ethylene-insensitive protein 2-like [Nelumbo nucifera]XP_010253911.1 PREDICTED: ethylene-insensitive protein 2-like [Nelumbo nucifera]
MRDMEADPTGINQMKDVAFRLFPAVGPMLLISMGYIDPGKWASAVEGGAHFGSDLVLQMLVFNFAAILCQYLAACIGLVTGKNLAQICSEEYNKSICIFLGVQAELSIIALDLTMILGIAHSLNLLFGVDLFTCVFLTALDAVFFPIFATIMEKCKEKVPYISIAGFILLSYILGMLFSQPEIPFGINGMLTRLNGESAFTLMSLLGSAIMPHNFYLHSSIVQQQQLQKPSHASKNALCNDHFFAILCVFSGIFLVNYVLMNSAATVFHNAGAVVLTFQDALLLMDQVFRSPMAPFALFLILFFSSHITALTWNLGGQVVLHYLFTVDLPVWLHRATIRTFAIVPALYCAWNSGAEGMYQLLIFAQVMLAMLLPCSVIPLFRVASSSSIMGALRISQFVEFLALMTFFGMLGLEIIFVVEVVFGNSDWVGSLRWNMGSNIAFSYVIVLAIASVSLCMMLWLATTPLKSASANPDAQMWKWDLQYSRPELFMEGEEMGLVRTTYHGEETAAEEPAFEKSLESRSDGSAMELDVDLPEMIMDSDQEPHATPIEEKCTSTAVLSSPIRHSEESGSTVELAPVATVGSEVSDGGSLDSESVQKFESVDPVGKTVDFEGELQTEKDEDEGEAWEPEESSTVISAGGPTLTSEGSGSCRSLSGKNDEGISGGGSLSRLSGLGRAARRQLAAILDEFWGQLYDFHGQVTQEAKSKKLDVLLLLDLKPAVSQKVDPLGNECSGFLPLAERNSSIYDSPKKQRMPSSVALSCGLQTGSSGSWSTQMQLLDAYTNSSSRNIVDAGERRYSSLRLPPSSEGWDYQPATVHGYQVASYLSRMVSERNADLLGIPLDPPTPKSSSFVPTNYRDSISFALGKKPQNGISSLSSSSIQNPIVSRSSTLQAERPCYDPCSYGPVENAGSSAYTKKYHSLPDISGLAVPLRDSYLSEKSSPWDSSIGFGPSVGKPTYEQSLYSNSGSRAGVPLPFDELSPSKFYRDALSVNMRPNSDTRSLWSRQPFEQLFGVAGQTQCVGDGVGTRQNLVKQETTCLLDLEAKLLQSFRYCIVKLLKLEGSDWLFRQNDGADEDLIDRVATRERFHYEAETREVNQILGVSQYFSSDKKTSSGLKNEEAGLARFLVSSVPHCGEGCVWKVDLVVSFGVWCIHRILELSLMESRPELWGKYTYVLNRLQGILDLAFSKPRTPLPPCFCLQVPATRARRSIPLPNGLPPSGKPGRAKCTSASMLLDLIKDVETAVSSRKGRSGTAAGDVAFPKGKENLASVLKRYKRRLSNKPVGTMEGGPGSRKVPIPTSYAL